MRRRGKKYRKKQLNTSRKLLSEFPEHPEIVHQAYNPQQTPKEISDQFLEKIIESSQNQSISLGFSTDEFENENPEHRRYILSYHTVRCRGECLDNCISIHNSAIELVRRKPCRIPPINRWNYLPELCKAGEDCKSQSKCYYAHNEDEIRYHPMKFKTEICLNRYCSNIHCYFAHGNLDLRKPSSLILNMEMEHIEMSLEEQKRENESQETMANRLPINPEKIIQIQTNKKEIDKFIPKTFKTEYCLLVLEHDYEECLKFHDYSDRRRSLEEFEYDPEPCPFAFNSSGKYFEPAKCWKGDKCGFAHSKVEIFYHPLFYKRKSCEKELCDREICPFKHLEEEETDESIEGLKLQKLIVEEEIELKEKEEQDRWKCTRCGSLEVLYFCECGHLACSECRGIFLTCTCKKAIQIKNNFN